MIEMASWGGAELKNLQFLVPKVGTIFFRFLQFNKNWYTLFQGMSEEVFSTLATMLPSIFRVSNPLVFKAGSGSNSQPMKS